MQNIIEYTASKTNIDSETYTSLISRSMNHLNHYKSGHTAYQLLMFVLSDAENPTPESKYQQALREIDARVEALKANYYQIRKAEIEAKGLEVQRGQYVVATQSKNLTTAQRSGAELQVEMADVEMSRLHMQLDTLRKETERVLRELNIITTFADTQLPLLQSPPENYTADLLAEHTKFLGKLGFTDLIKHTLCPSNLTEDADPVKMISEKVMEADAVVRITSGNTEIPALEVPPSSDAKLHLIKSQDI